jgi:hypothetical protein
MLEKARQKLIFWNVVVVISLLATVILALYFAIATSIQNEVDSELTSSAVSLLQATRFIPMQAIFIIRTNLHINGT